MERLYTWSSKERHIAASMMPVITGSNHKKTLFLSTANSKVHKVSSQSFKSDAVANLLPLHHFGFFF